MMFTTIFNQRDCFTLLIQDKIDTQTAESTKFEIVFINIMVTTNRH